jgi:hypothetical protein
MPCRLADHHDGEQALDEPELVQRYIAAFHPAFDPRLGHCALLHRESIGLDERGENPRLGRCPRQDESLHPVPLFAPHRGERDEAGRGWNQERDVTDDHLAGNAAGLGGERTLAGTRAEQRQDKRGGKTA